MLPMRPRGPRDPQLGRRHQCKGEETNGLSNYPEQTQTDNQQDTFLAHPQDTVALVGQPADLSCTIERKSKQVVEWNWVRDGMAIASGEQIHGPFRRRYQASLTQLEPAAAAAFVANSPAVENNQLPAEQQSNETGAETRQIFNYTLHIQQVSLIDDSKRFFCQAGTRNAASAALLSVWQPPGWVNVVAKIEESPYDSSSSSSSSSQEALLLASVVPDKQQEDEEQITRIVVRQNTRLRLECRSEAAKPEPKEAFAAIQSTNGTQHQSKDGLIESNTLVWSLLVQRQHNDHILTCQAEHPAFQEGARNGRFSHLLGRQPRQRVRLEVQFEPEITLTKDQAQAHEHRPIRFHCEARAWPNQLAYRWYIDDKPVANASEPQLQISSVTRQLNQREIRCQVSNEVGSNSAVLRLSVQYAPAFVTHLLPVSLQPQNQLPHEWSGLERATLAGDGVGQPRAAIKRHDIVLARQLAIGAEPNQDVELRCDFDGHPRIQQVHWFKLASDYSIMGNVTPSESDALIQRGPLYASFRYSQLQVDADGGADGSYYLPPEGEQHENVGREIDYEQMSIDELALIAAEAGQANSSQPVAMLEPVESQPPTPTQTVVFEPLDWSVKQQLPPASHQQRLSNQAQAQRENPQAAAPITTLSLAARTFASDEIHSSSVHSNRDRLNWRTAEVASSKLLLRQVNVDSVGKYVCQGKTFGQDGQQQQTVARALYLVLREKPRIVSHPQQTAQFAAHRQVSVECLAQINTVLDNSTQILWFKDGQLVEETGETTAQQQADYSAAGRKISIIVERSPDLLFMRSRLRIRAPTQADFGVYNCTISNSYGVPDSMAIHLQPPASTALVFRAIAAMGILSVLVLACAITCLLAFAPQRRKLAAMTTSASNKRLDSDADAKAKVNHKSTGGGGSDQLDSGAATSASTESTPHGSDTDSLRKSQASCSDQPLTEAPPPVGGIDDPNGSHLCYAPHNGQATNGAHMLSCGPQQQAYDNYIHHHEQQHAFQQHHHHHQQRQISLSNQTIYQQQPITANGWPIDSNGHQAAANGHYQMPASAVGPPSQPPPLPPPPPMMQSSLVIESPYVSNGRTYYATSAPNGAANSHYAAVANGTSSSELNAAAASQQRSMVAVTDGEAQFESQYGSMISQAYRALGYSTTSSSPSSGGGSSSGATTALNPAHAQAAVMTIGLQQHHSSGSASSSPNSMTTYHNLGQSGYLSSLSLQRHHDHQTGGKLLLGQQQRHQHSPPNSDIQLLMKTTSDINQNHSHHHNGGKHLETSGSYIAATSNSNGNSNSKNTNGLATHV